MCTRTCDVWLPSHWMASGSAMMVMPETTDGGESCGGLGGTTGVHVGVGVMFGGTVAVAVEVGCGAPSRSPTGGRSLAEPPVMPAALAPSRPNSMAAIVTRMRQMAADTRFMCTSRG